MTPSSVRIHIASPERSIFCARISDFTLGLSPHRIPRAGFTKVDGRHASRSPAVSSIAMSKEDINGNASAGRVSTEPPLSWTKKLRRLIIGGARSHEDRNLFHKLSLIAFFAWIGLGADGLSSSSYGPEEAFNALGSHHYLGLFVGLASVFTILIISSSYSQIIELFPSGGGGYLVATKLLSPSLGAVSGCALLVDYILTVAISVAAGADAVFSLLSPEWGNHAFIHALPFLTPKLALAIGGVLFLTLLNLRGVKESVAVLVPVFIIFLATHAFVIVYAVATHLWGFDELLGGVRNDVNSVVQGTTIAVKHGAVVKEMHYQGWWGLIVLLLTAYSMGAGTYTGIEAVSNGIQILREPRVVTGKRTMRYMAWSLAITVLGLMLAYLLFEVQHQAGKTLNAVLFESMTQNWAKLGTWGAYAGTTFVWVTLLSEALLLLVAAQAGFMDGPRVLSNMALDNWMPKRFATLSDRFVTQNGILIIGIAAGVTVVLTGGLVTYLVVLYSINVFITFVLSQSGMVRHWWQVRGTDLAWRHKFAINGIGLALCLVILVAVIVFKFKDGGWVPNVVTGGLDAVCFAIKRHYRTTAAMLHRLDGLVRVAEPTQAPAKIEPPKFDPDSRTAVLLVNGFSGVGLHTLFSVIRLFGSTFKNFVFIQIGAIDAGVFKGAAEIDHLKAKVTDEVSRYVNFMHQNGFYAEAISAIGVDIVDEAARIAGEVLEKYPQSVFFGGQLVFPSDDFTVRALHNYTVFAMQRKFYHRGIPFVVLPIRV